MGGRRAATYDCPAAEVQACRAWPGEAGHCVPGLSVATGLQSVTGCPLLGLLMCKDGAHDLGSAGLLWASGAERLRAGGWSCVCTRVPSPPAVSFHSRASSAAMGTQSLGARNAPGSPGSGRQGPSGACGVEAEEAHLTCLCWCSFSNNWLSEEGTRALMGSLQGTCRLKRLE